MIIDENYNTSPRIEIGFQLHAFGVFEEFAAIGNYFFEVEENAPGHRREKLAPAGVPFEAGKGIKVATSEPDKTRSRPENRYLRSCRTSGLV